jgi:hypothetical protein
MTNGGGASEKDRARRLTEMLGFEVGPLMLPKDYCLQFYAITHHFKGIYAQTRQQTGPRTGWKGRRATESSRKVPKISL